MIQFLFKLNIRYKTMSQPQETQKLKTKYNHISLELRKELIRLVEEEGLSIYSASRLLSIKNCTGKVIVRQFRRKGHLFVRKSEVSEDKKEEKELRIVHEVLSITIKPAPQTKIEENIDLQHLTYKYYSQNPYCNLYYWPSWMNTNIF